jgi:hypothetical protein
MSETPPIQCEARLTQQGKDVAITMTFSDSYFAAVFFDDLATVMGQHDHTTITLYGRSANRQRIEITRLKPWRRWYDFWPYLPVLALCIAGWLFF